jgi:hypothetical protein
MQAAPAQHSQQTHSCAVCHSSRHSRGRSKVQKQPHSVATRNFRMQCRGDSQRDNTVKTAAATFSLSTEQDLAATPLSCPWPRGDELRRRHLESKPPTGLAGVAQAVSSWWCGPTQQQGGAGEAQSSPPDHSQLAADVHLLTGTFTDGPVTETAKGLAKWWRYQGFRL